MEDKQTNNMKPYCSKSNNLCRYTFGLDCIESKCPHYHRGPTIFFVKSTKALKRLFLNNNIYVNVFKWLGEYDIAYKTKGGSNKSAKTNAKRLTDLSITEWLSLGKKYN